MRKDVYRLKQREVASPQVKRDAGFWTLDKEHKRDAFQAYTP